MARNENTQPAVVVFLDVDGTTSPLGDHIADAWGDQIDLDSPSFPHVLASPTLLRQIGALPAQIIWLTDWENPTKTFTPALMGTHGTYENLTRPHRTDSNWWKSTAALAWLDAHPTVRTVVWCDDHLNSERGRRSTLVNELTTRGIRHKLVIPAKSTGLTPAHLASIARFLGGNLT